MVLAYENSRAVIEKANHMQEYRNGHSKGVSCKERSDGIASLRASNRLGTKN